MRLLKKGKKKKGFTLIELIAVVAILIILAVLLIPNIVGYVNKSKIATVKSDAKVVLNIIKTAKAQSDGKLNDSATYQDATNSTTGYTDLAASKAPAASLANKTETELETIIDNNSSNWSFFSDYYQK